jgi:hypothetical protein
MAARKITIIAQFFIIPLARFVTFYKKSTDSRRVNTATTGEISCTKGEV